jgi:3-hydroxyacyl-CoA dehydrogenase
MTLKKIGVMSPGSMGQTIAQQLHSNGFEVCTALDGCSARQISTISARSMHWRP